MKWISSIIAMCLNIFWIMWNSSKKMMLMLTSKTTSHHKLSVFMLTLTFVLISLYQHNIFSLNESRSSFNIFSISLYNNSIILSISWSGKKIHSLGTSLFRDYIYDLIDSNSSIDRGLRFMSNIISSIRCKQSLMQVITIYIYIYL